jgi:hypothetical protein
MRLFLRFGLGLLMLCAVPVWANTIYIVQSGLGGFNVGPCTPASQPQISSSTPVSTAVHCGPAGGTIDGTAAARQGHLGVTLQESESLGGNGSSTAMITTDVIFTSSDPNATSVMTSLNLHIDGSLQLDGSANSNWLASVAFAHAATFNYGDGLDTGGVNCINASCPRDMALAGTDILVAGHAPSSTIEGVLTTPFVLMPLNTPVPITFSLFIQGFGNPGTVDGEFPNSLEFVTGGPVFNFADSSGNPVTGFTANDPDVFLNNNIFAVPTSSVPEGGSLLLFGSGLLGLAAMRRRFDR